MTVLQINERGQKPMGKRAGPVVYVASAFSGDITGNMERTKRYSRFVIEKGAYPINPILNLLDVISEETDREAALEIDLGILRSRGIQELWCFGEPSAGMKEEIKAAEEAGLPIRRFTIDMEDIDNGTYS